MGIRDKVQWLECEPDPEPGPNLGSSLTRIALAVILGPGAAWLGTRWAEAKALPGWTGPVSGVLTALLVFWLLRPRRKGL